MFIESCARTDRGRIREKNEDSLLHRPDLRLFAVADGMGGHAAGEIASDIAIRTLESAIAVPGGAGGDTNEDAGAAISADALAAAVQAANREVLNAALQSPELTGMGTTLTVLSLHEHEAVWAHVGDSRLYLYRSGALRQLTRDQTWVQQQVDAGRLTPEAARVHPYSSMLTQALGIGDVVHPEIGSISCYPGDRFLLCSDGLTGMLSDAEIAAVLAHASPCGAAADELIDSANQHGGADNSTVVIVHLRDSTEQRIA